jgi:hypothetical protein
MTKGRLLLVVAVIAAVTAVGCGKQPGVESLVASFAQQLAANKFIRDFQQSGDDLRFTGPSVEGGTIKWRVHIDSTVVEANSDPAMPYKGTVKSSWYAEDQLVHPSGRDSNLPLELTNNGLAQDCWALWDKAANKWGWE